MGKPQKGFLLGMNEKEWKKYRVAGMTPIEYYILFEIMQKYDISVNDDTLKSFTKEQQKYFDQKGITTAYIQTLQLLKDVKKAGTIGVLFDLWSLTNVEKSIAGGLIAGVNQELSGIGGLEATLFTVNSFFKMAGKTASVTPVPWLKIAGYSLMALSTILPFVLNKDVPRGTTQEATGKPKDFTFQELPQVPNRTQEELGRETPKQSNTPRKKPTLKDTLTSTIKPAMIATGAGAGYGLTKELGDTIKLVLIAVALYFLFGKK